MFRKGVFFFVLIATFACRNEDVFNFNRTAFSVDDIQTHGGSLNDSFQSIAAATDGGYVLVGFTQSNDFDIQTKTDNSYDFWVRRFSSNHTLLWSKTYGGSSDDRGADIVATQDGGFVIVGYSASNDGDLTQNNGIRDFWVFKIDAQGNLIWQKSFGFSGSDYGISVLKTQDNGVLLCGVLDVTASGGQGNSKTVNKHAGGDYWVLKLAQDGSPEWTRYFGGSFTDSPFGMVETADGNYVIAGSSDSNDVDISNNKGAYDYWVIAIDQSGNLIWEKSFGGSEIDEARGIAVATDGNILITGDTRSFDGNVTKNNGVADLWLIKIDTSGNLIWEKTIGGSSFDAARSISPSLQNGFIIAGSTRSSSSAITNEGQNDAWILEVNDQGNVIWQQALGGSEIDVFYDAIQVNTETIIAVGDSRSSDGVIPGNKGFTDGLVVTFNK